MVSTSLKAVDAIGVSYGLSIRKAVPDEGQLVDAIGEIAADSGMRHLMLVENPSKLFRFRRQEKRL
jgi:hypothetical protein